MKTMHKSILMVALLLSACGNNSDTKENFSANNSSVRSATVVPTAVDSSGTTTAALVGSSAERLGYRKVSVVDSGKQVIVNAANQWLAPGGALSGAIFDASGKEKVLADIAAKHNGVSNLSMSGTVLLKTSEVFTTGAHNLSSKGTRYIIHALGPDFRSAPYNNIESGYAALRKTYQNLYAEMDRLNQEYNVSSLGVIPISSGVFAGGANQDTLFKIMIEETLSAMQNNPALQPELCLFGDDAHALVKKILPDVVSTLNQSSALSSGVGSCSSRIALLDASSYVGNFGSLGVQGVADSFGSMRVMGNTVKGINTQLSQVSVGKMHNAHFLGSEFESAYSLGELTSYSLKAIAVMRVTDNFKVSSGLGYVCESMNARFQKNIRHFLNDFGIDTAALKRHGVVGDLSAQYHFPITSDISFTANVGLRAMYSQTLGANPFAHVSCQLSNLGVSVVISKAEAGLSVVYQH
jgi:O-acetyl-ADP-ribose deacetylase (regulator of RNase III)